MTCGRPRAWQVSRAAITASGEQQARSARGPRGVEPEAERDADRVRAGLQERDGAVDAAAHRDGDAVRMRAPPERPGAMRVGERVGGERLARHGRGLEQREPAQRLGEPVRVGVHDPVAVDAQPHERELLPARRISDELPHAASVPRASPAAAARRG